MYMYMYVQRLFHIEAHIVAAGIDMHVGPEGRNGERVFEIPTEEKVSNTPCRAVIVLSKFAMF